MLPCDNIQMERTISNVFLSEPCTANHQGVPHLLHLLQPTHHCLLLVLRPQPPLKVIIYWQIALIIQISHYLPSCSTVTADSCCKVEGDFPAFESALKPVSLVCSTCMSGAVGETCPAAMQSASASHKLDTAARKSGSAALASFSHSKQTSWEGGEMEQST